MSHNTDPGHHPIFEEAAAEMDRRAEQRIRFSSHLETCDRCADATEGLCAEGASLMRQAVSAT